MTLGILTDLGEEWYVETDVPSTIPEFGLYEDGVDAIGEDSDTADITTRPGGGSYGDIFQSITATKIGGDWGFEIDASIIFDTSDSSRDVDGVFFTDAFQADETSDASSTRHLLGTMPLDQTRNLSDIEEISFSAGDLGCTVDTSNDVFNVGEEFLTEVAAAGTTISYGLFNDSTDALGDDSAYSDISTEPDTSGSYAPESDIDVVVAKDGGNWGFHNDLQLTFNTSDVSDDVDHLYAVDPVGATTYNDAAADGESSYLLGKCPLDQTYDLSQWSEIDIGIGEGRVAVD